MKAKFVAIFTAALAVLPMASKAAPVPFLDSADPFNGFELSGFAATDVLSVSFVDTGPSVSWTAWNNQNCATIGGSSSCRGWITNLSVEFGVGSNDVTTYSSLRFPTPAEAFSAATAFSVTGFESYRFFINDSNYADNSGGVQLSIAVASADVPAPAPLALLSLGLVGLGLSRRKRA